ncbi:hypothetical protein [Natronococcus occultus]|uniref:Uncharacterized protein n=1 Tax=Natronococcus occultus SP4 TaxID=694430 RepID=L0K1R1_9EURY|nr:hypothetical protein [Natronococcus occultus]AGB39247.1 hypothetical protein Natoc_3522 [Natronococcus occultus SP4]
MKRALALMMTIALVGSLMFMGFAGTAAASHYDNNDKDKDKKGDKVTQDAHAETNQVQYVSQSNYAAQGDNTAIAAGIGNTAVADQTQNQANLNAQLGVTTSVNYADT